MAFEIQLRRTCNLGGQAVRQGLYTSPEPMEDLPRDLGKLVVPEAISSAHARRGRIAAADAGMVSGESCVRASGRPVPALAALALRCVPAWPDGAGSVGLCGEYRSTLHFLA